MLYFVFVESRNRSSRGDYNIFIESDFIEVLDFAWIFFIWQIDYSTNFILDKNIDFGSRFIALDWVKITSFHLSFKNSNLNSEIRTA